MDKRLAEVLEALLQNIAVLNAEVERFVRCDHFSVDDYSEQMIARIRLNCESSLQTLRTAEIRVARNKLSASNRKNFE